MINSKPCKGQGNAKGYDACGKEIWKDVKGYESLYMVSNKGRVKSMDKTVFNKLTNRNNVRKGRFLKDKITTFPYRRVSLVKDYVTKTYPVHRLVAIAFIPNPKDKPEVNHKNKLTDDNCVENLEWCTRWENITHQSLTLKSTSKFTGVSLNRSTNRWKAQLRHGKKQHIGYFDTEEEAFEAVLKRRKELGLIYELQK